MELQLTDLRELVERVAAAAGVRTQQRIVVQAPDSVQAQVDPLRLRFVVRLPVEVAAGPSR